MSVPNLTASDAIDSILYYYSSACLKNCFSNNDSGRHMLSTEMHFFCRPLEVMTNFSNLYRVNIESISYIDLLVDIEESQSRLSLGLVS